MALIECPECKREVSDRSAACVHCGYPFQSSATSEDDLLEKKIGEVVLGTFRANAEASFADVLDNWRAFSGTGIDEGELNLLRQVYKQEQELALIGGGADTDSEEFDVPTQDLPAVRRSGIGRSAVPSTIAYSVRLSHCGPKKKDVIGMVTKETRGLTGLWDMSAPVLIKSGLTKQAASTLVAKLAAAGATAEAIETTTLDTMSNGEASPTLSVPAEGERDRREKELISFGRSPDLASEANSADVRSLPSAGRNGIWAGLPGFRSGRAWKSVVAVLGYLTVIGVVFAAPFAGKIVAVVALTILLLATNAWGLRARVPGFRSSNRLIAVASWMVLLTIGSVALLASPSSSDERATRSASAANALASDGAAPVSAAGTQPSQPEGQAAPTDRTAQAQEHVDAAFEYRNGGQLGLALSELQQALAVQSDFAPARKMLDEVRPQATAVVKTAQAQEHVDAALDYRQKGQIGLALSELQQALGIQPGYAPAQQLQDAVRPQATAQAVAAKNAEATAVAVQAQAAQEARIRGAKVLDPRQLVSDPKAFLDQAVILQGKALTVTQNSDYTWVQLMAVVPGRTTTESIVIEFRPKDAALLKDECYRVTGIVAGTQKVTRTLTGATNEVPVVNGLRWQTSLRDRFGSCVAPS